MQKNQLQIITPNWPRPLKRIQAFSTTRIDGFSNYPFDSFNLGRHVGDEEAKVQANRALLRQRYQLPTEPLWLQQTHSNQAVQADQMNGIPNADAAFTTTANTICTVLSADCVPILITNQYETEVAAIHAGWRGMVQGIIESTLHAMSSHTKQLFAWIGPAISASAYLVKSDVKDTLIKAIAQSDQAIKPAQKGSWLVDLPLIATLKLKEAGVRHVSDSGYCTSRNKKLFYSYRRDGTTGRMATLIWIADPSPSPDSS